MESTDAMQVTEDGGTTTIVHQGSTTVFELATPHVESWKGLVQYTITRDGKSVGSVGVNPGKSQTENFVNMVHAFATVEKNTAEVAKIEKRIALMERVGRVLSKITGRRR